MSLENIPVASVGDSGSTATVLLVIVALIAVGSALMATAIWTFRSTRPEPEALGPLEQMGTTRWLSGDLDARRRQLDLERPADARPLAAEPAVVVRNDLLAEPPSGFVLLADASAPANRLAGRPLPPPALVEVYAAAPDAEDEPIDVLTPGFAPPFDAAVVGTSSAVHVTDVPPEYT